jgi:hypothetical protein
LQVPGEIFEQQESFSAEVTGWNGKRTDQLVVKFDDGTQVRLLHMLTAAALQQKSTWTWPAAAVAALAAD